jgi:phosphatidylglycerol:prolipoprotein diacylglycerol transferase
MNLKKKKERPVESGSGKESKSAAVRPLAVILGLGAVVAFIVFVVQAFAGKVPIPAGIPLFGKFTLRYYSLALLSGVLAGLWVTRKRIGQFGMSEDHLWDLVSWGILFGLVGARTGYVLQNLDYFAKHPAEIVGITPSGFAGIQGLSIHGALLALLIYTFIFQMWRKYSWRTVGDLCVPGIALGQSIGRWGNFFNQELYGYPTDVPWKMYVDEAHRLPEYAGKSYFHPVFLYESIWDFGTFLALIYVGKKMRLQPGSLMFTYGVLYGIGRFLVEFVRIEPRIWMGLSMAQIVSLVFILVWGSLLVFNQRANRPNALEGPKK